MFKNQQCLSYKWGQSENRFYANQHRLRPKSVTSSLEIDSTMQTLKANWSKMLYTYFFKLTCSLWGSDHEIFAETNHREQIKTFDRTGFHRILSSFCAYKCIPRWYSKAQIVGFHQKFFWRRSKFIQYLRNQNLTGQRSGTNFSCPLQSWFLVQKNFHYCKCKVKPKTQKPQRKMAFHSERLPFGFHQISIKRSEICAFDWLIVCFWDFFQFINRSTFFRAFLLSSFQ